MSKKLGIGAIVSFQCKFIHPHRLRDSKYPDLTTGKRLTDAVVIRRALKRIKHKETVCVVVHHDNFKDDENGGGGGYLEIWCTESHVRIEKEGDINLFFEADHCSSRRDNNDDGSVERDNITKEENCIAEKNKFEESNDAEEDGSLEKENMPSPSLTSPSMPSPLLPALLRTWPAYIIGLTGGFLVAALDPFSPQLQLQFGWCAAPPYYECSAGRENFAFASLALFVGAIFGSLVCRFVAEVGRVFALRMICCFVVPGSLIAASAFDTAGSSSSGLWMLIAGRFVAGIGVGWVCICCPLYVSEAVATEHRGKFLMVSFLSQAFGSFAASLLGLAVRHPPGSPDYADTPFDRWWWRAVVLTPVPLCLFSLLSLLRLRETPYILCKRGDPAAARAFLQEVHGEGADPATLREEFEAASGQAERSLSETRESPEARLARGGKKGEYRHALAVGASLGLLQNLSGARALLTSSASIFEAAGLQPYDANVAAAMLVLLLVLSILASLLIIDDWGRRKSLLVSFSGQALSALVGAAGYWAGNGDVTAIVGIFLFMLAYGLGVAGIPCAYLSEIFPRDFAPFGMGIGAACNWLGIAVMTFVTLTFSNAIVLTTLLIISAIACVFVAVAVRETKDDSIYGSPYFSEAVQMGRS